MKKLICIIVLLLAVMPITFADESNFVVGSKKEIQNEMINSGSGGQSNFVDVGVKPIQQLNQTDYEIEVETIESGAYEIVNPISVIRPDYKLTDVKTIFESYNDWEALLSVSENYALFRSDKYPGAEERVDEIYVYELNSNDVKKLSKGSQGVGDIRLYNNIAVWVELENPSVLIAKNLKTGEESNYLGGGVNLAVHNSKVAYQVYPQNYIEVYDYSTGEI